MSQHYFDPHSHDPYDTQPLQGRRTPPPLQIHPQQQQQQQQQQPYQYHSPPHSPQSPSAHPDSAYARLNAQRRYSNSRSNDFARRPVPTSYNLDAPNTIENPPPPPIPAHRDQEGRYWGRELGYTNSAYSNITPGADNFGEGNAGGGLTGIAMGVADANARESGLEAERGMPSYAQGQQVRNGLGYGHEQRGNSPGFGGQQRGNSPGFGGQQMGNAPGYAGQQHQQRPYGYQPYQPEPQHFPGAYDDTAYVRPTPREEISHSSLTPLGAAAFPPGAGTPSSRSAVSRSPAHSFSNERYTDNPYKRFSRNLDPSLVGFDPNSIEDDGDDGLEYPHQNRGGSMLSLGHGSDRSHSAAGGAAAGGIVGTLGGLVGRNAPAAATTQYDPVHGAYGGPTEFTMGEEKSEWLSKQKTGKKKMKWIVTAVIVLVIILGVAGGVVAGILTHKKSSGTSQTPGQSASQDTAANGDLNKNSAEIKKLMNNPNLHKVFPGIDYTPMNTQYPDCLTNPPSQNNVTRDLAILSQLTNTVRLYGTDCNQTEMLLHSIDQLGLNDTTKVWLGVWIDANETTNARQLSQMYNIFDTFGAASFKGVIIGNEVLFREDKTAAEMGVIISDVRANFTSKGISLPIASSDLGDNWTAALASEVDYVMANIHPFFAGVSADTAASWTWNFWQTHDVAFKTDPSKNIISETGWPSQGGTDCGGAASCPGAGSVAGIQQMNRFMDDWVCQALGNGTSYFWFEAFDEPWKVTFDTPGKEWEDQWGLLDVNRNLKKGVVVPDCGGKTVS